MNGIKRKSVLQFLMGILIVLSFGSCQTPKVVIESGFDGQFVNLRLQKEVFVSSVTSFGRKLDYPPKAIFRTLDRLLQPGRYEFVAHYGRGQKEYKVSFSVYKGYRYYLHFDNTIDPQELILDEIPEK